MLDQLFDTTGFVPRSHCGAGWTPALVWWNHVGNGGTFLAYTAIPLGLMILWWRTKTPPAALKGFPRWTIVAFAVFIFFCGVGHAWDVALFYWPPYRLTTVWRVLTMVVSFVGVVALYAAGKWVLTLAKEKARLESGIRKVITKSRKGPFAPDSGVLKLDDARQELEALLAARPDQASHFV